MVYPVYINGVILDGPVKNCLVIPGNPINIGWRRTPVVSGKAEPAGAEETWRVIGRHDVIAYEYRLGVEYRHVSRRHQVS